MNFPNKNNMLMHKKSMIALIVSDILAFVAACLVALMVASFFPDKAGITSLYNARDTYSGFFFLFVAPIILYAFLRRGHYTRREPWWSEVRFVFFCMLTAFAVDASSRFLYQVPLKEFVLSSIWIFSFGFILLGRQVVCHVMKEMKIWDADTILIGKIDTVTDLLYAFHADYYTGYDVKTVLLRDKQEAEFDMSSIPAQYADIEVLSNVESYKEIIHANKNSYFVIDFDTFRGDARDELIQYLNQENILYSIVPPTTSMRLFEMRPQNFFGYDIMLLQSRNVSENLISKWVKRLLDLSIGLVALIGLSPVFFAVAFFQKKQGQGGSLFYGGERIGKDGKKFKCWKFRSMEPESDYLMEELINSDPEIKAHWDKYQKLNVEDPRVKTKVSRIMRKTSIDELPQIWNVIKGDMSLVGPRPILEREIDLMETSYNNYIQVRPGITGLWQVSGRNDTTFARRIYMDNWYVRNRSIWGDITILFKTIKVVLKGSGM